MASSSLLKNYNVKPIILGLLLILLSSSSMTMARVGDGVVVRRMSFEWPWEWCANKGGICSYSSDCCEGQGLVCELNVPGAAPSLGRCCSYNAADNLYNDCGF
ncbi:unnamed protein product [Amaranthus hypochondriacus]